jgi:pimeloyl-ACP methyl ester carboxylesterase
MDASVSLRTRFGTKTMWRNAFLQLVLPPHQLASADKAAVAQAMAELFGHDLADQPSMVMEQMTAMSRYDATSRLGEFHSVPALVVSAQHDRIAKPEFGKTLADGIPGSRYVLLEDALHGVSIHGAEMVNRLLLDHMERVEKRWRDAGRH